MTDFMEAYRIYGYDFEFCTVKSKKECPLREKCMRAITPPFSDEYWVRNGVYNKETKQCDSFLPIEKGGTEHGEY